MEGFVVRPLTLRSIGGHDVLLNNAHDLLGFKNYGRSVEEIIWSWIGSKSKEIVLDWIHNDGENIRIGQSRD